MCHAFNLVMINQARRYKVGLAVQTDLNLHVLVSFFFTFFLYEIHVLILSIDRCPMHHVVYNLKNYSLSTLVVLQHL